MRNNLKMATVNLNKYTTKKTISHGMLNLALLMSNCKNLKRAVDDLKSHDDFEYAVAAIILLSVMILLQVLIDFLAV